MFEQAILVEERGARRSASLALSMTMQMLFVATALMVPLFLIEGPSVARLSSSLMAPPAPPPPRMVELIAVPKSVAARVWDGLRPNAPSRIQKVADIVEDAMPDLGAGGTTVVGGTGVGPPNGVIGSVLTSMPKVAPPPPPPAAAPKEKPVQQVVQRITQTSSLQAAKLVRKVMPVYPPLAKQARISGLVKLVGIINREGRIVQLQVQSGHPLLVGAAVDAVRQWIYSPTLLSGEPVEVIAPIDVHFMLSQ